ncbi:hypothetical protein Pan97_31990 [Bremerella volcania]|uniref:Pilus assembly protein, PilO n=2 Tax=Bremerella volcania TaxID=2527984 RepID=A0A518CAD7_9BACT|nr:hypothetical protein Pan97_31990 [Bremerella volcania]
MIAFKKSFTRLLRHPSAFMVGIIVTFVVALVTLIPAADEYSVLRERSGEAVRRLESATNDRDELSQIKTKHAEIQEALKTHQERMIDEDAAHAIRSSLVHFARGSNCHLRRVDLGPVRIRQWHEKDHPVETVTTAERGKKTDFRLEVRELRLTLTGSIDEIESFLEKFETLDVNLSLQDMKLKSLDAEGDQIQLELALQLFGVRRATKEESMKS